MADMNGQFTGYAADARSAVSRLIDHVYPALSDHGDAQTVTGLLRRLDQQGTGADRQRALFASAASPSAFARRSLTRRYLTACNRPADLGSAYVPRCDFSPERKPSRAR
jgi:hypothetical protein